MSDRMGIPELSPDLDWDHLSREEQLAEIIRIERLIREGKVHLWSKFDGPGDDRETGACVHTTPEEPAR